MSSLLETELRGAESALTGTGSQPSKQFCSQDESWITQAELFCLYWQPSQQRQDTVYLMVELLELARSMKTIRHPRFGPVEIGRAVDRELNSIPQAIEQAIRNLKMQVDYLEQTR